MTQIVSKKTNTSIFQVLSIAEIVILSSKFNIELMLYFPTWLDMKKGSKTANIAKSQLLSIAEMVILSLEFLFKLTLKSLHG